MSPSKLTFIYTHPDEATSHGENLQKINSHVATIGHSRKNHLSTKSTISSPWTHPTECSEDAEHSSQNDNSTCKGISSQQQIRDGLGHIWTPLDPFVRLPLEVTLRERALMHYYLSEGRCLLLGTSERPAYCPALSVACQLLERCSVYVLSQIVVSEAMLCIRTQSCRPFSFYARQAQAYNAMNELLSRPDVSFSRTLFAWIQILIMEQFIGSPDLETLHLQAMHDYIESQGGLISLSQSRIRGDLVFDPLYYAAQFVFSRLPFADESTMHTTCSRFLGALQRIQGWAAALLAQVHNEPSSHTSMLWRGTWRDRLASGSLIRYSHGLIRKFYEFGAPQYPQASPVFFFFSVLCTIMAEGQFDAATTVNFLLEAQQCMEDSTSWSGEGDHRDYLLRPKAATKILGYIRRQMALEKQMDRLDEIPIAQAAIDAQRIFGYLSAATRLRLMQDLVTYAFSLKMQVERPLWDALFLKQLKYEIGESWTTPAE